MIFRNVKKEKQLFERELEIWKEEQRLAAKEDVRKFKENRDSEIISITKSHSDATISITKEFEKQRTVLKSELAKIEAKKEALEKIVSQDKATYDTIISHKDVEIERLNVIIEKIVASQPQTINVHTD